MQVSIECPKCRKTYIKDDREKIFICPACNELMDLTSGMDQYLGMKVLDPYGKEEVINRSNVDSMVKQINDEYKCGRIHTIKEEGHDYIVIDKQKIDVTEWNKGTWVDIFIGAVYEPFLMAVQQNLTKYSKESLKLPEFDLKKRGIIIGKWDEHSTLEEWLDQTEITLKWRIDSYIPDKKFKCEVNPEWADNANQACEETLVALQKFRGAPKHIQSLS